MKHLGLVLLALGAVGFTGCDKIMGGGGGDGASDDGAAPESNATPTVGKKKAQSDGGIKSLFTGGAPKPGVTSDQCGALTDGGPVPGPDCITAKISCGETITGHTKGGVNKYNTRFYEQNYCWPGTRNHNGGDERVYMFSVDDDPQTKGTGKTRSIISFDTPCADLDLTYINGESKTQCPANMKTTCDTLNPKNKPKREDAISMWEGEIWYFIVEGAGDEEGAFSLTLECNTTRMPLR